MSGRRTARLILILLALVLVPSIRMKAQFKEEAFSQSYNSDADSLGRDTSDVMFSFKDYFRSISHKKEGKIGTVFAGSTIFIGGQQIYNRDYWKLPVIYGGIAAGAGTGILMRSKFNSTGEDRYKKISTWCFAGAGLIYWGALMDGVVNYKSDVEHLPGRATLYAVLVPGLGQVYNGSIGRSPSTTASWQVPRISWRSTTRITTDTRRYTTTPRQKGPDTTVLSARLPHFITGISSDGTGTTPL